MTSAPDVPPDPGPADPTVRRAARELRRGPAEPHWGDISAAIVSKIGRAPRRTWPIDAEPSAQTGDRLQVSDRVVRTAVRGAVNGLGEVLVVDVDLVVEGHRCLGACLTVVAKYGVEWGAAGCRAARVTADTIADVLGQPMPPSRVSVSVDGPDPR